MKKTIAALIVACIGCCALTLVLPIAGTVSVLGLSQIKGASLELLLCALPLALLVGVLIWVAVRRQRKAKACAVDKSCGCS